MSDLNTAINEALTSGQPTRNVARVPVREPRPLCVCGHVKNGHGSIDGGKSRCLNCRCDGFRNSGATEDPDQIAYRLVDVPTEGDQVT